MEESNHVHPANVHPANPEPLLGPEEIAELRSSLLAWYRVNRRDLPWRHTQDPYAIWVSEIILYHMVKQVLSFVVNLCANHDSPVISVS